MQHGAISEEVKQLAVITPAIMGPAYFREAAEVIGAAAGSPPDPAKMMGVFKRHGMTLATPPSAKYWAAGMVLELVYGRARYFSLFAGLVQATAQHACRDGRPAAEIGAAQPPAAWSPR